MSGLRASDMDEATMQECLRAAMDASARKNEKDGITKEARALRAVGVVKCVQRRADAAHVFICVGH